MAGKTNMKQNTQRKVEEEEVDDVVCLDESFFINDNYELTTFTFGPHVLQLFCLQSASTDYDLTGQMVWPGAMLLNNYLSHNTDILQGCSIIELGSGVGISGILCSRFCHEVLLTDHKEEVIKILNKNIELHTSSEVPSSCAGLTAEMLEWGNADHMSQIIEKHSRGFDLVLGADICFQQSSIPPLFDTVEQLLRLRGGNRCKFILAYVSRAKMIQTGDAEAKHLKHMDDVEDLMRRVTVTQVAIMEEDVGVKHEKTNKDRQVFVVEFAKTTISGVPTISVHICKTGMDDMVIKEAIKHGMQVSEVEGTRSVIRNLEGVIFEISLN